MCCGVCCGVSWGGGRGSVTLQRFLLRAQALASLKGRVAIAWDEAWDVLVSLHLMPENALCASCIRFFFPSTYIETSLSLPTNIVITRVPVALSCRPSPPTLSLALAENCATGVYSRAAVALGRRSHRHSAKHYSRRIPSAVHARSHVVCACLCARASAVGRKRL